MQNSIRLLRRQRSLTQAGLAEALGVSRQTVISIESSKYDPGLELAFRIARFFEQSIEQVFRPEDAPGGSDSGRREISGA